MTESVPVGVLLKVAARENERLLSSKAEELGLTGVQMHILHFICRHSGRLVLGDVENKFDLTHATCSGIISRLESKGFLQRVPDEKDRRRSVLVAEEKAIDVDHRVHAFILNNEAQMLSGFDEAELKSLRGYLMRVLDNMGVKPPRPVCEKEDEQC